MKLRNIIKILMLCFLLNCKPPIPDFNPELVIEISDLVNGSKVKTIYASGGLYIQNEYYNYTDYETKKRIVFKPKYNQMVRVRKFGDFSEAGKPVYVRKKEGIYNE